MLFLYWVCSVCIAVDDDLWFFLRLDSQHALFIASWGGIAACAFASFGSEAVIWVGPQDEGKGSGYASCSAVLFSLLMCVAFFVLSVCVRVASLQVAGFSLAHIAASGKGLQ